MIFSQRVKACLIAKRTRATNLEADTQGEQKFF